VSTTHRVSRNMPLYLLYKCSHCGELVVKTVRVGASSSYTNYAFNSASTREAHFNQSMQAVGDKLDTRVQLALNARTADDFLQANLPSTFCPKCKKRQPWDTMTLHPMFHLLCVPLVIVAELQLFASSSDSRFGSLLPVTLALIAAVQLARILFRSYWKHKSSSLLAKLPPLCALTIEALKEKAQAYEEYAGVNWVEHTLPPHTTFLRPNDIQTQ